MTLIAINGKKRFFILSLVYKLGNVMCNKLKLYNTLQKYIIEVTHRQHQKILNSNAGAPA